MRELSDVFVWSSEVSLGSLEAKRNFAAAIAFMRFFSISLKDNKLVYNIKLISFYRIKSKIERERERDLRGQYICKRCSPLFSVTTRLFTFMTNSLLLMFSRETRITEFPLEGGYIIF